MKDAIRIQMMDTFTIYVNESIAEHTLGRSRKGLMLIQYLIANMGKAVPRQHLLDVLWADEKGTNPENALKTLISRMRVMLNSTSEGLGNCIVADSGGYRWQTLPGMRIDLYEIEEIFSSLEQLKDRGHRNTALYVKLMELYTGDLLKTNGPNEWALGRAVALHSRYLEAVNAYVEILKEEKKPRQVVEVCRRALDVDPFDDHLHIELMSSLISINRTSEALQQYRHVVHMYYRYLGVEPSQEMQEFYRKMTNAGNTIEFSLEAITEELTRASAGSGAYICDYSVFKEIFSLQMRNLERLGSTIFLGIIMVESSDGEHDTVRQDSLMNSLCEILRENLRRGDTVTRFSPTVYALLLPTVNYSTGNMVMERVKRLFYRRNPSSDITYNYLIGPLGGERATSHLEDE